MIKNLVIEIFHGLLLFFIFQISNVASSYVSIPNRDYALNGNRFLQHVQKNKKLVQKLPFINSPSGIVVKIIPIKKIS
jgi:hypothetical protein